MRELSVDGRQTIYQLGGGFDVAQDGGHVALQFELPRQEALDGVHLFLDDFLPGGKTGGHDEGRFVGIGVGDEATELALTAEAKAVRVGAAK